MIKVLMIDNFDSFTFNLVDDLKKLGASVFVVRNTLTVSQIEDIIEFEQISHLVFSPGPGSPEQAGYCMDVIKRFYGQMPMLGICLGMQAMVVALGGRVTSCKTMVHGKNDFIQHKGRGIFSEINNPMMAGRYHSLSAQIVPKGLVVSAEVDNIIMAVENYPAKLFGVQFHPESILTPEGSQLIKNFLSFDCLKPTIEVNFE